MPALRRKQVLMIVGALLLIMAAFGYLASLDPKITFIASDIAQDHVRFTAAESVDIAMAMKIVTHDPVKAEVGAPSPPQLLFPPSAEDLARLSGE